jgi:hypothetical protein
LIFGSSYQEKEQILIHHNGCQKQAVDDFVTQEWLVGN